MHFFTWVLALWLPIALQLNFKSLETVIDWLIILTNCLNRLQNRKYTLAMDIIQDVDLDEQEQEQKQKPESDEFYRRLNKMNQQVKETYSLNETNNQEQNKDLEQFNQEQYYKEMEEMQEQINKLSQLQENNTLEENTNIVDDVIQSHDSTPEEYKDIEEIVAKVNSVNNKIYIDESLE